MQEHRAATVRDAGRAIVVDLDDKIIEVILTREPIAVLLPIQPQWLVVMAARGVFAPRVFGPDGTRRQQRPRAGIPVGPPPEPPGPEDASRRAAVAFPLVGPDAAPAQRDRHRQRPCGEPTPL